MLKYKSKIEDVRQVRFINKSILHKSKNKKYKLIERNKDNLSIIWESEQNNISDYAYYNNWIVYDSEDDEVTFFITLDQKIELFRYNFTFSFNNDLLNEKYLVGNSRRKGINILDIDNKTFFTVPKEDFSALFLYSNYLICLNRDKNLITQRAINSANYELFLVWQFNISQFGTYKEKPLLIGEQPKEREREIYRIFYHNEKIIVTLSRAIIAINPEDGSLLWKIDFPEYDPVELVFNGNIAYLGRYVDYVVIDIEKGKKVYERDTTKDISIEISGTKINRFKYSGLVYHSNFIWFTQSFEGIQYLLKAKPENGEVIDGMVLETKVNTYPPIFDETRVYILDMEGVLYVYEI